MEPLEKSGGFLFLSWYSPMAQVALEIADTVLCRFAGADFDDGDLPAIN